MLTMSMNRVIHGAFRRDLDRFVSALDDFRDGDAARAAALGRAWANFDAQLVRHHEGEHETAWPHLERAGITRATLDQMDAEHAVMAGALEIAREEMNGLVRDPSRKRADAAREAMRDLRVATLTHLDHEERELEAFYVTNADHPEVKAMEGEFRKESPAVGGQFFAWILDGITPDARAAIPVPGPVLGVLTGLFGRGYRRDVAPVWR
jgi:hemerythrin-like domain-containing protein